MQAAATRCNRAAVVAAALALASAAVSLYWTLGGKLLLDTVGGSLARARTGPTRRSSICPGEREERVVVIVRSKAGHPLGMDVRLKRVYEPAAASDGERILIDRIWPRGVTRERAQLDEWARELAPSTELRHWFAHDPARFREFRRRYIAELAANEGKLRELRRRSRAGRLTLVYAARDDEHNDAMLADVLRRGRRS